MRRTKRANRFMLPRRSCHHGTSTSSTALALQISPAQRPQPTRRKRAVVQAVPGTQRSDANSPLESCCFRSAPVIDVLDAVVLQPIYGDPPERIRTELKPRTAQVKPVDRGSKHSKRT